MKSIYGTLAALGLILPYLFFMRFLSENGLNLPLFFEQLTTNDISIFFAVDLVIATVAFWVFAYRESHRYAIPLWRLSILTSLIVGLSCALPLFLYLRERAREQQSAKGSL